MNKENNRILGKRVSQSLSDDLSNEIADEAVNILRNADCISEAELQVFRSAFIQQLKVLNVEKDFSEIVEDAIDKVASKVSILRNNLELTKKELANIAGVERRTVSRIEKGKNTDATTLLQILTAMGYTLEVVPYAAKFKMNIEVLPISGNQSDKKRLGAYIDKMK